MIFSCTPHMMVIVQMRASTQRQTQKFHLRGTDPNMQLDFENKSRIFI